MIGMTKYDIKLEETFLDRAREQAVPLRFTLANRERVTGVVVSISRYDLGIQADSAAVALPKKEIFHISSTKPVLEDEFFAEVPDTTSAVLKSRVQDEFLARYITEKTLALILLTNGEEIRGVIEGYDGFTVSIRTTRGHTLIYKHGICSIGPGYRRHGDRRDAK